MKGPRPGLKAPNCTRMRMRSWRCRNLRVREGICFVAVKYNQGTSGGLGTFEWCWVAPGLPVALSPSSCPRCRRYRAGRLSRSRLSYSRPEWCLHQRDGDSGLPGLPPPALTTPPAVPSPDLGPVPPEPLQVFVSAAESPARFWVQLVGRRNLRLDRLRADMRRHYRSGGRAVRSTGHCPSPPLLPAAVAGVSPALSPPPRLSS